MEPLSLETLRRIDQAHHLHPFTDHGDLHRQGTRIIRSMTSGMKEGSARGRPMPSMVVISASAGTRFIVVLHERTTLPFMMTEHEPHWP